MDVSVRHAVTRILGSARASRAAIGALANRKGRRTSPNCVALGRDFGEGAEICTRGRVRSPEVREQAREVIRRGVGGIARARIRDLALR
jgi:hypothetical protein